MAESFSHRDSRSPAFTAVFCFLISVETGAVHLLLYPHAPVIASALSLLGLAALVWLIGDYFALGSLCTTVDADTLELRVGRRASATIPRRLVASAISPSRRDVPASPAQSFLNLTKPAEPNVLITFTQSVPVTLVGGFRRPIRFLALCVDRPEAFLAALCKGTGSTPSGQAGDVLR